MKKTLTSLLLRVSVLAFATGCPYTEGCESVAATPGPDAAAPIPLGPIAPNCVGLTALCAGESCCAAADVPGGTFNRIDDPSSPATITTFRLDTYEVVVGRFRSFVNAGQGTRTSPPAAGAGAHPLIADSGWDSTFNAKLEVNTAALHAALRCDPSLYDIYREQPGENDTLPMNCVTWFEAMAFCAWDGGRLPTEAEWLYAAEGGDEQRVYPWGNTIDSTRAQYGCQSGSSKAEPGAPPCTIQDFRAVGLHPAGRGRWGHADLASNTWERVLDWYHEPLRYPSCVDCANLIETDEHARGIRGGSFNWQPSYLRAIDRTQVNSEPPNQRTNTVGFRCARAVPR